MTKKVLVLLADGFEEIEFTVTVDVLVRAGVEVTVAGVKLKHPFARGSRGIKIVPDVPFEEQSVGWDPNTFDAIVCPGGMECANTLKDSKQVQTLILTFYQQGKIAAFICAATLVALNSGIPSSHTVTSYPSVKDQVSKYFQYSEDRVVVDKNVVTSRGPGTAFLFALTLVEQLVGKEMVEKLKDQLLTAPTL